MNRQLENALRRLVGRPSVEAVEAREERVIALYLQDRVAFYNAEKLSGPPSAGEGWYWDAEHQMWCRPMTEAELADQPRLEVLAKADQEAMNESWAKW